MLVWMLLWPTEHTNQQTGTHTPTATATSITPTTTPPTPPERNRRHTMSSGTRDGDAGPSETKTDRASGETETETSTTVAPLGADRTPGAPFPAGEDPLAAANLFEASKIKNFLYKQEPDMPRLSAASLELVSTTAALLLKSIVDRAVLEERHDRKAGPRGSPPTTEGADQEDGNQRQPFLVTTSLLKRAVLSPSPDGLLPSLPPPPGFLLETYRDAPDRDASAFARPTEYAPRTRKAAKRPKRTRATQGEKDRPGNRNRGGARGAAAGARRLLGEPGTATDGLGPLERAIADASASAVIPAVANDIVEDEDDYD